MVKGLSLRNRRIKEPLVETKPILKVESPKELREIHQKIKEQQKGIDQILTELTQMQSLLQSYGEIAELKKELLSENLKITQMFNTILSKELNK